MWPPHNLANTQQIQCQEQVVQNPLSFPVHLLVISGIIYTTFIVYQELTCYQTSAQDIFDKQFTVIYQNTLLTDWNMLRCSVFSELLKH